MDTGFFITRPYRISGEVRKFYGDDQTGAPFEVVTGTQWYDVDGTPITDPERIAQLEQRLEHRNDKE